MRPVWCASDAVLSWLRSRAWLQSAGLRTALRVLVSLLIAGLLLAFLGLWGGVQPEEVVLACKRLTWRVYGLAFLLHAVIYVLRSVRYYILFPPQSRPPFGALTAVSSASAMAAGILPAKVGEATFVLYLKNVCGVPATLGAASLIVARLLDVASLCLALALACATLVWTGAYPKLTWLASLSALLTVIAAIVFALSMRGDRLVRVASATLRIAGLSRTKAGERLLAVAGRLEDALRQAGSDGRLLGATLVSLPLWLGVVVFCALIARGMGLPETVTLAEATFGTSLAILTSLVPLSAFANFGTLETGWVLGFGALGVDRSLASATGFGTHVVQILNVVIFGLLGHLGMAVLARRPRSR